MANRGILSSKTKVGILLLMNRHVPVCGYIEMICRVHLCLNGFIPVDERDLARMQFWSYSGKRHDCGQTLHFSVMNCSSIGPQKSSSHMVNLEMTVHQRECTVH